MLVYIYDDDTKLNNAAVIYIYMIQKILINHYLYAYIYITPKQYIYNIGLSGRENQIQI